MEEQQQTIDPELVIRELTLEIASKAREIAMLKAQLIQTVQELNELKTFKIK